MGKKIYVGNMNYNTTQETLEATFGEFGAVVSVKIITDHVTGRPKGFAFIEMETEEAASAITTVMNQMGVSASESTNLINVLAAA